MIAVCWGQAGVRVHPAAGLIRELGYTDVHPLPEGFVELAQLGFGNVETGSGGAY